MEPGAPDPVMTPGRASERSCNAGFSIMQYISGSAVLTAIVLRLRGCTAAKLLYLPRIKSNDEYLRHKKKLLLHVRARADRGYGTMAEPEVEELTDRDKVWPSKGQDEAPVGEIAPPPTGGRKPMEGRIIRGTKREWTARLLVCFSWNITPSPDM